LRIGLTVPFEGLSLDQVPGLLRAAERLGYQEAWSYERNLYDAFTPLAAGAPATERMRLGASIVPVFTRPAGLVAMSALALAELAPGRFVLGLGASTRTIVTDWMGLPFARPLSRVRETVLAVRALLAGERVGGMRLHRTPPQPVPVYLAALGERMLRLAGEIADGVVFFLAGPGVIPELTSMAGGRLDSVARVVVAVGNTREESLGFARRFIAGYTTVPAYARFLTRQGFGEEVRAVQARWSAGDRAGAAAQVSAGMVDELMLVDHHPRLEEWIARYAASGLGCLDLWFMSMAADPQRRRRDIEEAMERVALVAGAVREPAS
jgi:probable F420-dependent oxidoreductase